MTFCCISCIPSFVAVMTATLRDDGVSEEFFSDLGGKRRRSRSAAVDSMENTAHNVSDRAHVTGKQLQDAVQWLDLGLCKPLVRGIAHIGYLNPTPVQAMSIPHALRGLDLCVRAVTGSGKTASFMLPLLHRLLTTSPYPSSGSYRKHVRSLLLAPTRELAQQCNDAAAQLSQFARDSVRIALVIGGMSAQAQEAVLADGPELVIATPGRLCDVYCNFDVSAAAARARAAASALTEGAPSTAENIAGGSLARSKLHYAQHSQTKSAPTVAKSTTNRARDFLDLSKIEVVVFDECDKLVAPELLAQVEDIAERVIHRRVPLAKGSRALAPRDESLKTPQVCLYSATMTNAVSEFADRFLENKPLNVDIGNVALASQLRQHFVRVPPSADEEDPNAATKAKTSCLVAACTQHYRQRGTLIFCKFRTTVHRLTVLFNTLAEMRPEFEDFRAVELQGSQSPEERSTSLQAFVDGKCKFLFATDIASRGLDLPNAVTTVINFDMPATLVSYIHRVGRTARIGHSGLAVSMVDHIADADIMRQILALSRGNSEGNNKLSVSEVRRRVLRDEAVAEAVNAVDAVFPTVRETLAAEEVQAQIEQVEKRLSENFDDVLVPLTAKQRSLASQRRRLTTLDEHAKSTASSENDPTRTRRRRRWARRLERQEAELMAQMSGVRAGPNGLPLERAAKQWILSPNEQRKRSEQAAEAYKKQHASAVAEAEQQLADLDRTHARLDQRDRASKAVVKRQKEAVKDKVKEERKRVMAKEAKKVQAGVLKKMRRKKVAAARREVRRSNPSAKRKPAAKAKAGSKKKFRRH